MEWLRSYLAAIVKSGDYKSSALTPLLWLNLLVTLPCVVASFELTSNFRWAPFGLAVLIVVATIFQYSRLVKKDPRLVQSERFQREMRTLDIVAERGGPIIVNPVDLLLAQDPRRRLPSGKTPEPLSDEDEVEE